MVQAKDTLRQVVTAISVPLGIALNFIPMNGVTVRDSVGDNPDIALNAAGYAFAIWGLIFGWQIAYAVYQALPSQRESPVLRRVGWWAALNAVAIGLWAVAVVNDQRVLSWGLILVMLAALVVIEARIGARPGAVRGADYWLVRVPYRINLGWVSVATILSTGTFLRDVVGWNGGLLGEETWAVLGVVAAAALGLAMLTLRRNFAYAAVIVWALVAVAVGSADVRPVWRSAAAMAVLVTLGVVFAAASRRHRLWLQREAG